MTTSWPVRFGTTAAVGWAVLVALPFTAIFPTAVLYFLAIALLTVVASLGLVVSLAWLRRWKSAVAALLVVALIPTVLWTVFHEPSDEEYFDRHRALFVQLAADDRASRLPDVVDLPEEVRDLSVDGTAHHQDGVLYIPTWVDWRDENGRGLAYFATPPEPGVLVGTAGGDMGKPTRLLGDGWWVVQ